VLGIGRVEVFENGPENGALEQLYIQVSLKRWSFRIRALLKKVDTEKIQVPHITIYMLY
jgi:hypothetical protein